MRETTKRAGTAFRSFHEEARRATVRMEVGNRMQKVVDFLGVNQAKMAALINVAPRTLARYLKGETCPTVDEVQPLKDHGVNISWLMTGDGEMLSAGSAAIAFADDFVLVPRYDVRVSAGAGEPVHSEQVVDHLAFKREWVRDRLRVRPDDLALVQVVGDSMEPTLSEGDLALVHLAERRLKDGAAYVIEDAGELRVKRIARRLGGSVLVKSDNPRYGDEEISGEAAEQLRVLGQVIWHGGVL